MIETEKQMNRGDIFWIDPHPEKTTLGSVQEPARPAIIVSNQLNNKHSGTLEVVYLTTAEKKDLPTHVTCRSSKQVSTVLCEQITTISKIQVAEYIGTCTDSEMQAIDVAMLISLGISMENSEQEKVQDVKVKEDGKMAAELAKAQSEAEIYRKMYHDLLDRVMAQK